MMYNRNNRNNILYNLSNSCIIIEYKIYTYSIIMSNYAFEVSMGFSPKRLRGLRVVFVS